MDVINVDIWEFGGRGETGYCIVLEFRRGCAIQIFKAKYKKDVMPKFRAYKKLLSNLSTEQQLKLLHNLHDTVTR